MASRWLEKMLTMAAMTRMAMKNRKIVLQAARVPARREEAQREVEEGGAAVGHRGHDGQQADQVQPAGVVAGLRPAQLGRPPVDAARRRVGGHQLGQAQSDAQDQCGQDRPAPGDGGRAATVPPAGEGREATGQDRDDRERDGEVGEAGPGAVELLLVPELGEQLLVGPHSPRCSSGRSRCGSIPSGTGVLFLVVALRTVTSELQSRTPRD